MLKMLGLQAVGAYSISLLGLQFSLQFHLQFRNLQDKKNKVLKEPSFSAPPPPDPAQTTSCSTGVMRRRGYGGVCDGAWVKQQER
jgi:hypothetical protein